MTLDEKLEHFYSSVIESATNQNVEIIEEYKKVLQKSFEERKETAHRKADNNYRMASDNIIRERNRKISTDSTEIRRKVLYKTAEYTDQVFIDARHKIDEFMKTSDYDELLYNQIMSVKNFAGSDAITVYINPADEVKKTALEARTGITLTVSKYDFIGGTRAVIPSHSILIDNSFSTKLEEAKSTFTL